MGNIRTSKVQKNITTQIYVVNGVSETETAGYLQFGIRRGDERRGRKKSRDDSGAEYLHCCVY
jgi:hypothetical protein